jgi:quercetin dioxygenase-like cupin family protein
MKNAHYLEIDLETPKEKDAKDIKIRWLISKKDKANNFAMRLFEVKPGGYTPYHQHNWEHELFILEGTGIIKTKYKEESISTGHVLFVPPMEWHQFKNNGTEILKFLCLIPYK